jgi:hypothetical protein
MIKTADGSYFLFGNASNIGFQIRHAVKGLQQTVQFKFMRSGSETKPNHVSLQTAVINYSLLVGLDKDWEAIRSGARTRVLSAVSSLFV